MLRLGILSVVPLVLAGGVAHDWTQASAGSCAALGPAAPSRSMAFTSDPSVATVKVQIVDKAELADLAIADDVDGAETDACGIQAIARLVTISTHPVPGEPVLYLTRADDADYRIYVDSTRISPEAAAALIVSARGGHLRLAASSTDGPLHTASAR